MLDVIGTSGSRHRTGAWQRSSRLVLARVTEQDMSRLKQTCQSLSCITIISFPKERLGEITSEVVNADRIRASRQVWVCKVSACTSEGLQVLTPQATSTASPDKGTSNLL